MIGKLEWNFQATLPLPITPLLTYCDVTDVGGARFGGYCATLTATKATKLHSPVKNVSQLLSTPLFSSFGFCFLIFLQCWSVSEPESIPLCNCPAQHMQGVKSCARCRVVSSLKHISGNHCFGVVYLHKVTVGCKCSLFWVWCCSHLRFSLLFAVLKQRLR